MSAFGGKADIAQTHCNVCLWHKADITTVLIHVCFYCLRLTQQSSQPIAIAPSSGE